MTPRLLMQELIKSANTLSSPHTFLLARERGKGKTIMKTIDDLKKLVKENGGKLEIGLISIQNKDEDGDIDIYFDEDLIQWYGSSNIGTESLNDKSSYSTYEDIKNNKTKIREQRDKIKELEDQLEIKSKQTAETSLAEGKVAAYELLLVGKNITIAN